MAHRDRHEGREVDMSNLPEGTVKGKAGGLGERREDHARASPWGRGQPAAQLGR